MRFRAVISFAFSIAIIVISISCRSRLKPVVYEIRGESRHQLSTRNSYYMENYRLVDTTAGNPLKAGSGNLLVAELIIAPPDRKEISTGLIKAVGEMEYRVYIALPAEISPDSLDIAGQSVCRIIGLYELTDSLTHYVCAEGYLKIDTVKSSRFHAILSGKYHNVMDDSLRIDGDLSVTRKK